MAIIPDIPGIEVDILVGGKELVEYADEEEEASPKKVVRYVEATSGAHFKVKWCTTTEFKPEYDISVQVLVDGEWKKGRFHRKSALSTGVTDTCKGSDTYTNGQWFLQKFWFSQLATDEDASRNVDNQLKKLIATTGQISVKMFRVTNFRTWNPVDREPHQAAKFGTVPEKALKGSEALSHHACLDAPVPQPNINMYNFDYVDGREKPFATYVFKYRSLVALKALYIIPPTPPLEDRPVEGLSHDELKQLQEQLRIYKQRVEAKSEMKREVKTEPQGEPVVVDEDDDEISVVSSKKRKRRHTPQEADEVVELD
ncbi:hypothetical protein BDV96DRAFT_679298 [Lophiotrema nucula]|uniref:DUF7918 domain-containing protein n=1 Tax=Lophiotrema nucula TaxID=690887 RepID=A0A6A5ZDG6_9PLEO|nr:hypothetical protein BDV96DRAFT_679298 [Lophiotrema nucula]